MEHRGNEYLIDADYFSRLGKDLCFDPLLLEYVHQVIGLRKKYPAPERLPMQPQHMPHYRGPRIKGRKVQADEPVDTSAMEIIETMHTNQMSGPQHLSIIPVHVERYNDYTRSETLDKNAKEPYHLPLLVAASRVTKFNWAVYSFNSGHFISTVDSRQLPFLISR